MVGDKFTTMVAKVWFPVAGTCGEQRCSIPMGTLLKLDLYPALEKPPKCATWLGNMSTRTSALQSAKIGSAARQIR
jgi:hypothetical protein